ncbi:MAG: PAS domain S-box protein [Gemmataceae bacterium]|nr:PAS domain S-box protein [Gemmataceae bacterium]MCI0740857.1 PAS domain S-box protein [Gemmataceae bacterium]
MSQQEEVLYEQKEWLRVTLSSIGDAVITTDAQSRVTFLNPAAQTLTGWTQQEADGKPLGEVFRIVNEESRQPVENPAVRALREGLVVGLANHTLLTSKDGTERPIDDSAAPIRNRNGEIAGVVLIFRDISERRRSERAVQNALDFAESIIDTLREPFLVLDRDLRVLGANRSFHLVFQVTQEETQSRYVYELGNRQWDIPRLRTLLEDILPQNHAFQDFEVEHEFPNIGRRIMLLNARRVRGLSDSRELILLAIEDITERRHSEARIEDSELRYRKLFETARDGILLLDADTGKITEANPFMSEILGYAPEQLLGKELWEIGLFQDKASSQAAFRQLQERGYIRYDHLPLRSADGKQVDVEFVSNLYQADHQPVIQCNIRDITERRQLEWARAQAQASADLHRRKDEFLAMLSHELRNPLAPILNAVQLLRHHVGSETRIQEQARSIIERQVGLLRALVDELLEVSRITTGRIRLHYENVDMRGVVDRAVESVRPLIDKRRHRLTVSLPAEPIWLHADSTRLEQVVVNLLTNAAKYTDESGRIALILERESDEAVLRVRDTGVGIAPDLLPRIFDLFTQAERSLDRAQGGLGVGLTVVQKLVEMHRGKVEAYSALGRGSEFVVRLPVVPPPGHKRQAPVEAAQPPAHPLHVLVVDDNVDQADSAALLLRMSGHEVRVAYSGPAALEAAIEYRPDIVLMDIGLPGMDGYEVARHLRQQPALKDTMLVAVTGYGQESDRRRSQEARFDHHLVKPVNPQELEGILALVAKKL